ncbi:MAG: hypothetical protein HOE76_02150 [Euryarchaeota archaeon]|jgi:hypothetical protein|nr:hypothetical protein [Euryarchaeota archaeon]MBT4982291.1 hypothetical protein [Euryarchaeota archaeon]MBT5185053.1 hypothetical protein [Euryarchaeota archaeon]
MRGRSALAILLAILLSVPVVGGTTTTMEDEEIVDPCMEDPEQPCENQTVLYLWSNGQSTFWSHFNANETDNAGDNMYSQERPQGVINIDQRFSMNPQMSKRLNMTLDGEVRIVLNIYLDGDWTNNDNDGPCTNDCEELNITLWAGATTIFRQHVPQVSIGWNPITVTHRITEGQTLWDASTANPSIQIEMKVKGDRQQTSPITVSGEIANFTMKLSAEGDTRVELPIDPVSWDEAFQAGEDGIPVAEEQPGFLFMSALATMTLAAVYLPSKKESEDSRDRS